MNIEIDLKDAQTKDDVLNIFGKALGYTEEKKWGKNWDALNDILGYLNTGGIYGTNEIILAPVFLIRNFNDYRNNETKNFAILLSILNDEKSKNPDFDFHLLDT